MKALKIVVEKPPAYVHAEQDREYLHVGQTLRGWVQLDEARRPKTSEIRWVDGRGRVLGRTAGRYDAYQRRLTFSFALDQNPFWIHFIECDLEGERQAERAQFSVSPTSQGWETMPAITWATYPYGEFYDRLQEVGVNGQVAYKMAPFDATTQNGMRFYVDQGTHQEISLYHRPFKAYWEDMPIPTGGVGGYRRHWQSLLDQYRRLRAQARKQGVSISRNAHARKLLWRRHCPNDPGTVTIAGERFAAVVRQHKGFRPLFQNIADEAGIADQTQPFDFCYCPYCMDKFRILLRARYGTLTELNRQWGSDFAEWDAVFPPTCDETMEANRKGGGGARPFNFAGWADHREFMDDTFAHFFHRMAEVGRAIDPAGTYSQGGTQWPTAYGGWDYAKITRTVDAIIPYNLGGSQELVRSLRPQMMNLSPFFGDDERHVRGLWQTYLHGDAGVIFWDADEKTGRFVTRPGAKPSRRARLFGPALREIRGGVARQCRLWKREDDAIGLLYSQPSERAHWMLETLADHPKMEWFDRVYRSRYAHVRMSWQKLVEDRQFQYRYVSYLDLDEKKLDLSAFKMLILPESLALSETQATALRDFVHGGGTLVADGRVGRMTANCRQRMDGALDDLFGVRHAAALRMKPGPRLRPARRAEGPWLDAPAGARNWRALDGDLRLADGFGAQTAAYAGQAPALIRRRYGSGWAVLLNADVAGYETDRYRTRHAGAEAWRAVFDALAEMAGLSRAMTVTDAAAGTSAGIETTQWRQGGAQLFSAILNREFRLSGVGEALKDDDLAHFEKDRNLSLSFPEPAHTWDARTGEYLGRTDSVRARLPRLSPLILSRLPYRVRGVTLRLPARVSAGERVELDMALKTDGAPADHVLRVDVHAPDGQWLHWYSATPETCAGKARHAFRLAFNDTPGTWRVNVRDTVTGLATEKSLRVTKG